MSAMWVDTDDTPVPMLTNRQQSIGVEGQAVGAGLCVDSYIEAGIAAFCPKYLNFTDRRPAINHIGIRRAKQQIAGLCPYRTFGKDEVARHFFQPGTGRYDSIQCRICL